MFTAYTSYCHSWSARNHMWSNSLLVRINNDYMPAWSVRTYCFNGFDAMAFPCSPDYRICIRRDRMELTPSIGPIRYGAHGWSWQSRFAVFATAMQYLVMSVPPFSPGSAQLKEILVGSRGSLASKSHHLSRRGQRIGRSVGGLGHRTGTGRIHGEDPVEPGFAGFKRQCRDTRLRLAPRIRGTSIGVRSSSGRPEVAGDLHVTAGGSGPTEVNPPFARP